MVATSDFRINWDEFFKTPLIVNYPVSKNTCHFYFYDNFGERGPVSYFFTVKFRNDLRKKKELKLPPPLKSVATLPCET